MGIEANVFARDSDYHKMQKR